jgi:hypothetical protein
MTSPERRDAGSPSRIGLFTVFYRLFTSGLGRARPEELLALGELIEPWSGVVSVEVLDEDRDQQACLGEAAL